MNPNFVNSFFFIEINEESSKKKIQTCTNQLNNQIDIKH